VDDLSEAIIRNLLEPLDPVFLGPNRYFYCYLPLAGGCPAREFLDSLNDETQASYAKLFEYHCQGHQLRGEKWRPWTDGLYEYKDNPSKSRLMHITERGNLVILLYGFTGKKENKVDQIHVNQTKRLQEEYKTRVEAIKQKQRKKS
jgi:hypothetical protein